MKFAICNETYGDWPFERVCEDVARCGYEGIEIAPSTLEDDPGRLDEKKARAVAEAAHGAGLEVVGLHWLLLAPAGLHLTTRDPQSRARTVRHLEHLGRVCAAMGGKILVLGSPQQRSVIEGDSYDDAFARAADVCRVVCESVGPLGVTLALEPIAPAYTNFLTTAAETVRLIEAVDHPACRLHLDVCAMCSEPDPIEKIIVDHGRHLAHFHANDANLRGPGSGDVDYAPIVGALRGVGYDEYVSVEVFDYQPDGPMIARESLEYLRRVWR